MEKMDNNLTLSLNSAEIKKNGTEEGTIISSLTPILFCTSKGLHIRSSNSIHSAGNATNRYQVKFCDLEQWSSKRAESVTLVDTHVVQSQPAPSHTAANKLTIETNSVNKSGLLERPQPTGVFTKAYARFDVK